MDALFINTIRGLCSDATQRAEPEHPGTPTDVAPVAYTLWRRFLHFFSGAPCVIGAIPYERYLERLPA
ncbi:hypothetical protein GBF35_28100 [Nonomuraea phyllanthi]|uniref:hypothetical protein n=1 Tax=Nonomuraea phyllanthi TaxID=2219224 RepID=UPI0012931B91|nr:hypothetical protein GBF35_28100 [Nonomuraea phyllanthi]